MRTGNIPANAELTSNEDGSVLITLTNEDGDVLDTYVIDPITGKGTTVNGDAIDLPQTGNNAFGTAAGIAAAISMTIAGAFVMLKSGKLKKKEFED
jgi:hypothetical protein